MTHHRKTERIRDSVARMMDLCERIFSHMHRFGGREEFLRDWTYQDACVMVLVRIGEEAKKHERWLRSNSGYDWFGVIGFRDSIHHNYSNTDYGEVWSMMEKGIPELMDVLEGLVEKIDSDRIPR